MCTILRLSACLPMICSGYGVRHSALWLQSGLVEIGPRDFSQAAAFERSDTGKVFRDGHSNPASRRPEVLTRWKGHGRRVSKKGMYDELAPAEPALHSSMRRSLLRFMSSSVLALLLAVLRSEPALAGMPYMPRLLYPGTYGNYCGPTPEVASSGACMAHGWRGDDPIDRVDAACLRHDLAYCACAEELRDRAGVGATPKSLSILTALRSTGLTQPLLESQGADATYFSCVRRADQGLIQDGINVRRSSQRSECSAGAYETPSWFCQLNSLTLSRIELVDFDLFLRNLDFDLLPGQVGKSQSSRGLKSSGASDDGLTPPVSIAQLEWKRRLMLRRESLRQGKPLSDAASSVSELERAMELELRK